MTQAFGKSQKIVIVEDNQALSDIYKTRLEMLGYTVFAAFDGVQALAVIEKERPNLVLLDLMIPKVAGDQVLERMRESDWGKDIKVMIISNLNEKDAPAGLRNLGIEGYAVKANLSNDQLDKLVEVILKPVDQVEDVVLAHTEKPELSHAEPSGPPDYQAADPLSGTNLSSDAPQPEDDTPQDSDGFQASQTDDAPPVPDETDTTAAAPSSENKAEDKPVSIADAFINQADPENAAPKNTDDAEENTSENSDNHRPEDHAL